MILKDYRLKVNLKAACEFEYLTGKPYNEMDGPEDIIRFFYCILTANNDIEFTYDIFLKLFNNKKVFSEVMEAMDNIAKMQNQYNPLPKANKIYDDEEEGEEKTKLWMNDVANYLIVNCGIDAHYVMYEMDLREIMGIVEQSIIKYRNDLDIKRYLAFLDMSPLRLNNKVKGPEDVMPFSWDKPKTKELGKDETSAALAFLKKTNK